MNKNILFLLSFILFFTHALFASGQPCDAWEDRVTMTIDDPYPYNKIYDGFEIPNGHGPDLQGVKILVIQDFIHAITKISHVSNWAFYEETLEEIVLEGFTDLRSFERNSFSGFRHLKRIRLPYLPLLETMDASTFASCENLEEITLPCPPTFQGVKKGFLDHHPMIKKITLLVDENADYENAYLNDSRNSYAEKTFGMSQNIETIVFPKFSNAVVQYWITTLLKNAPLSQDLRGTLEKAQKASNGQKFSLFL